MKMKYLALALLTGFASVEAAAQSALPRKDIPTIAEATHFDIRPGINAFDRVLNATLFQLGDELFVCDVSRSKKDIAQKI